jgi:protein gp37
MPGEDYIYRIDALRQVPARVRFISFEPLLAPILDPNLAGIHWVIVGGIGAVRATNANAVVEALRHSCERQRVAFFFKQWGGPRKKNTGRLLQGKTWDEYPGTVTG